jgi:hypothetical protein
VAEALLLAPAEQPREAEHSRYACNHRGQHGHEDLCRLDVQRARDAGERAAPRREIQHAVRENGHARETQRIQTQPPVERQHRGDRDHVGRRTVAIERDQRCKHRRSDDDFQRIVADDAEDRCDQRVEQTDVDHQTEVQDREHQHHAGRRECAQAREHHLAKLRAAEAAEQCKQHWDADQGDQRRQPPRHDQRHERRDHAEAEESQIEHGPVIRARASRAARLEKRAACRRTPCSSQRARSRLCLPAHRCSS